MLLHNRKIDNILVSPPLIDDPAGLRQPQGSKPRKGPFPCALFKTFETCVVVVFYGIISQGDTGVPW